MTLRPSLPACGLAACVLLVLSCAPPEPVTDDSEGRRPASVDRAIRVDEVLGHSAAALLSLRKPDGQWNVGYYLGTFHASIYFLKYLWFGADLPLDPARLRETLLGEQYPDGSWKDFADANFQTGTLDATIINYFALKAMGEAPSGPALSRARSFILAQGGVEESSFLVKFTLALFHNYPWDDVARIPDLAVKWIDFDRYAQWISSNFYPVVYLRKMQVTRSHFEVPEALRWSGGRLQTPEEIDARFVLTELYAEEVPELSTPAVEAALKASGKHSLTPGLSGAEYEVIKKLVTRQLPKGSWGAYGPATFLTMISLRDFFEHHPDHVIVSDGKSYDAAAVSGMIQGGLEFLRAMQTEALHGNYQGLQSYGNYWDTVLATNSLLEAGRATGRLAWARTELAPSCAFMLGAQGPSGGIGFGYDFQSMPDADDGSETILAFSRAGLLQSGAPEYLATASRAKGWLLAEQNDDGGWPAFGKNIKGDSLMDTLIQLGFKLFAPAPFLTDPSSADVTGHALEALAAYYRDLGAPVDATAAPTLLPAEVARGIAFLKKSQVTSKGRGMWEGKWGVNYLYGTSAAVLGLLAVGVSADEPYVARALGWLQSVQNADGGFGETTASYDDPELAGQGVGTPTQTAWALVALIAAGRPEPSPSIERGIDYLLDAYQREGRWTDTSIVGTGHPGYLYMKYDSYPSLFPVLALARYRGSLP